MATRHEILSAIEDDYANRGMEGETPFCLDSLEYEVDVCLDGGRRHRYYERTSWRYSCSNRRDDWLSRN